jgi:hypothetical protein
MYLSLTHDGGGGRQNGNSALKIIDCRLPTYEPSKTAACGIAPGIAPQSEQLVFEANGKRTTFVDKGTRGGNPPHDIFGGQYRRHRLPRCSQRRS